MQTQHTKQQSHNAVPTASTSVIKHGQRSGAAKKAQPTNCAKQANGNTTPPAKTQAKPKNVMNTMAEPSKRTPPKPPAETVAATLKPSNASNNIGTNNCVQTAIKKTKDHSKVVVLTKSKPKDVNAMQPLATAANSLGGRIIPIAERKGTTPRF